MGSLWSWLVFFLEKCQGAHLHLKYGSQGVSWAGVQSCSVRTIWAWVGRWWHSTWLLAGVACPHGQLSFYSFLSAGIPEFAEVDCSGKRGMRVINCLNCALVFALRQIPPPYRVQSSLACQHVVVTTCWEAHQLSHLELGKWWVKTPALLQDLTRRGDAVVQCRPGQFIW